MLDSPWPQRLAEYNRQAFPYSPVRPGRHFVVRCHENLAEFLAEGIHVEPMPGEFDAAAAEALRRVIQ